MVPAAPEFAHRIARQHAHPGKISINDKRAPGRFGLAGSYIFDYDLTLPGGTRVDGVGKRNITNSIGRSLPSYKVNGMAAEGSALTLGARNVLDKNPPWVNVLARPLASYLIPDAG